MIWIKSDKSALFWHLRFKIILRNRLRRLLRLIYRFVSWFQDLKFFVNILYLRSFLRIDREHFGNELHNFPSDFVSVQKWGVLEVVSELLVNHCFDVFQLDVFWIVCLEREFSEGGDVIEDDSQRPHVNI